jgi:hypothetical protein
MGPHLLICPCLSVCARPSRFLTGSLRPLSGNSGQRGSLPRLGIDDLWVSAETEEDCLRTYKCLIELLLDLGFVVNRAKCVPPTTRLTFLGIALNSDAQFEGVCRVTIPAAKGERATKLCEDFLARIPDTEEFIKPRHTSPVRRTPYGVSPDTMRPSPSVGVYTWRTFIMLGHWPEAAGS